MWRVLTVRRALNAHVLRRSNRPSRDLSSAQSVGARRSTSSNQFCTSTISLPSPKLLILIAAKIASRGVVYES